MRHVTATGDLSVKMAEIGIGFRQGTLKTLLGSCIGILLYERRLKVAGLAHIVLPDSAGRNEPVGKYVDTAIPETIRLMKLLVDGEKFSLIAKIAGGANMFPNIVSSSTSAIGQQNLEAVERWLAKLQIPILARDVGNTFGRRMIVDIESGEVQIHVVGKSVSRL